MVLALIVLGPTKLPQVARSIGRGIANLRKSVEEVKREIDLDEIKKEWVDESGLEEVKTALDVRGEVQRTFNEVLDPIKSKESLLDHIQKEDKTPSEEVPVEKKRNR